MYKNKTLKKFKCKTNLNYGAIAVLNMNNITGIVKFRMKPSNKTFVEYEIDGLEDGKHGFHIHQYGNLSDGCNSACAHFNPDNTEHGGPYSKIRHAGDLGNIVSKKNKSKGTLFAKKLTLSPGKYCITGRMIIVHEDEDDLGKGGDEESLKTGNAGKRLTCGVIGLAPP